MEEKRTETLSGWRFLATVMTILSVIMCTVIITLMISRNYYSNQLCGEVSEKSFEAPKPNFLFSKKTEWSPVETMKIEEKGVKVVRTYATERCYIMPLSQQEEGEIARPMILVPGKLSFDMIEQVAGEEAAEFCEDLDTYLLKDPQKEITRQKRQSSWKEGPNPAQQAQASAAPAGNAGEPAHWRQQTNLARAGLAEIPGGELKFGRGGAPTQGQPGYRPSGLDFPYEQRVPRCMDLVLDCGRPGAVGEVQECFTWVNGVIKMAQRCIAPNKFEIFMTKPPGRILKVAQKQWILCVRRRKQGFRC